MSFASLCLCDELLQAIAEQGYTTPTAIQLEAIPAVLSGRDVMAAAHTGTGKTASFTLPMVQRLSGGARPQSLQVRALVITPTRELAAQVTESVQNYSCHLNIRCAAVFGGVRIEPQIAELQAGLDVLVGTPGRLLDLYNQGAINFDQLEILVLDEADRMLDMGFIDDIRHIQRLLPEKRQTLMFSATFSEAVKSLAEGMFNNPFLIEVAAANTTAASIKQVIHPVDKDRKSELLIELIKRNKWHQVLVFSRTKRGADSLVSELEKVGIRAASIHADRSQHARTEALENFRNGKVVALVATDIAARGIDVSQLPCVVNFDLPYVAEDYVHRIGRTGRAGTFGLAVSLVSEDEYKQLKSIEEFIGMQFERKILRGFMPTEKAPASVFDDSEYGSFEPNAKPKHHRRGRGKSKRRR
ncbi:ATP-dependent RNA helicase RhlE [Thiomicrorhabdus immobilis]|uniref:ATP-dependent RNA helicase RhlE n=1 Tax=Thiomicrorhabdus immobilis TaxID=2791037 RepID=A0ABN6CWU6_9GAMM|nr:DEAD/DEAH box helicase [Thiomicrorhabdus immobilis]BCN93523.1 ATP-dependent RNA helicase RhlE [Thiomicrorhabdus immobilis]